VGNDLAAILQQWLTHDDKIAVVGAGYKEDRSREKRGKMGRKISESDKK
jgi:hypothetical protein